MTEPDHYKLEDGSERWELDDKLHRDDGPALITPEGKSWYRHGQLHRDGGPAVEMAHGTKKWFQNDVLHRDDGPAIDTGKPGTSRWFVRGVELTPEQIAEKRRAQAAERKERREQNIVQAISQGVQQPVKTMKPLKFGKQLGLG
jgi:hypothetical protein